MIDIPCPLTFSPSRRDPLLIGEEKVEATTKSGSEPAQETSKAPVADPTSEPAKGTSKAPVADPASEPTKAAVVVVEESAVPPETAPLVVELEPQVVEGDDDVVVEGFEVIPRPRVGVEDDGFPIPSLTVAASDKDDAMALVSSPLHDPHQAVLRSIPPFSGPPPSSLDASDHFPLAVLAEKRAKEQLADISLLRSSVEYALGNAAKEVTVLKRELEAANGLVLIFLYRLPL